VGLLGRKRPSTEDAEAVEPVVESPESRQITAPKGRPTPKRDAAKRRGPVAPAPMTTAEARRRRKEIGGRKLSREERREARTEQRQRMADRRERMMAGEEGYLLPRDQGRVRRYVRDLVDARRGLLGLFMPIALGMVFLMMAIPSPRLNAMMSIAMMVLVLIMVADAFILGRKVNRLVDQKFPNHTEGGWRLGFYAASRASQIRRMRAPRPQVKRGDAVT
jgi:Protein of unknown function (DUF3043)